MSSSNPSPSSSGSNRELAASLSQSSFRLVLASQSPRRRALLREDGYRFATIPAAECIEKYANAPLDSPCDYVRTLATLKAQNVAARLCGRVSVARWDVSPELPGSAPFLVVGCDSVAVCNDEILGKPRDREDAERMLRALSGSVHRVVTGLALWRVDAQDYASGPYVEKLETRVESSSLEMEELGEARLAYYLDSGLWEGKAGAFGYQDGNDWLKLIEGTESNVVGLPLEALADSILARFSH